jgi:CheY-like chemotaxis protein
VLEASGVLVVAVTNGRAALDQLRDDADHFDLAILDVRMPFMTGLQVLREATRMGVTIPIVLMTSFGDAELHQQGRALGAMQVIDKPVDVDQLRQIVHDAIQRSSTSTH